MWVIKIGGNVLDDTRLLKQVLDDLAKMAEPFILVHGGGKRATELGRALGVPQKMIKGRRITNTATLDIALMAYAGEINKKLVAGLQARGVNALGLTGVDGNMLKAKIRDITPINYGWVGDPDPKDLNVSLLKCLLNQGVIPVFCAMTHDGCGQMLNTNADTIASCLAIGLADHYAIKLFYLFEKDGVLRNVNDSSSMIENPHLSQIDALIEEGVIQGGMLPKMANAASAIQQGVKEVLIGSAPNFWGAIETKPKTATRVVV